MPGRVTRETLHGQVIYPDALPHRRGNMVLWWSLFFAIIMVAVSIADAVNKRGEYISFLIVLILYPCLHIIKELIKRLLLYFEERNHIASRYGGSTMNLLKKLFDFTKSSYIFMMICVTSILCVFLLKFDVEYHIRSVSLWEYIVVVFVTDILQNTVNLSKSPVNDSIFLENLQRLDYGSGMALNFYYGYLRLCLPHTGDREKGIEERINDYISRERLSDEDFPVKKIFILIPSSTYVPNDLKDISFGWMENAGSLEEQVKYRAGVKDRVYKNTVYRIQDPEDGSNKKIYVVAEGATPCKTLYEVVQYSGSRKEFYKMHQKEIVFNFYETLREILREDRDCRDLCEFIYYFDTDEFGLNNINVAKLILQRIEELRITENYLKDVRNRNI